MGLPVSRSGLDFRSLNFGPATRVLRSVRLADFACLRFSGMRWSPVSVSTVGKPDDPGSFAREPPSSGRDTMISYSALGLQAIQPWPCHAGLAGHRFADLPVPRFSGMLWSSVPFGRESAG